VELRIEAAHGPVEVSSNDEELGFYLAGREVHIGWDDMTGAGMARPPAAPTHFPREQTEALPGKPRPTDIVPFGNRLLALTGRIGATHRALVVAHGADRRGFQVFLPLDDPGTTELVDELRTRLGERWLEGDWELGELRSGLGLRLGLRDGALGVAFVLIVAVGGSLAILGWAGVVSAARDGDASLLRPYTIIPLVLWLLAVWYVLRRFRRS
jgi:hypothetical protein